MVDRSALGDRLGSVPSELALTPRRVLEVSSPKARVLLAVVRTSRDMHPMHCSIPHSCISMGGCRLMYGTGCCSLASSRCLHSGWGCSRNM